MDDLRALRADRLNNEYNELMRLGDSGPVIKITPLGNPPFERYKVIFNIRTIISPAPDYRDQTVCTLTIPPNYPEIAPTITADDTPYPWHINWFKNGRWCFGTWTIEESLVNYLYRCAKTLQFDPGIANPNSVANGDAMPFWNANKDNKRIIPCDTQVLPTLDVPLLINVKEREAPKTITIKPQREKPKIKIK